MLKKVAKAMQMREEKLFSIALTVQKYSAVTWVVELKEGNRDSEISGVRTHLYVLLLLFLSHPDLRELVAQGWSSALCSHLVFLSKTKIKPNDSEKSHVMTCISVVHLKFHKHFIIYLFGFWLK